MTNPSEFQPLQARSYPRRKLASMLAKASAKTLYEVPAGMSVRVDTLVMCSVHSGNETITVQHVRPGETAGTSNSIYHDLSVTAKTTTVLDATLWLCAGDRIVIVAGTADRICVTAYGEES